MQSQILLLLALCVSGHLVLSLPSTLVEVSKGQQSEAANIDTETTDNVENKFDQFKQLYHKHYSSKVEELRRRALFYSSSFMASVSQLKFKNRKATSYQRVGSMSDWTKSEFDSALIDAKDYYEELKDYYKEMSVEQSGDLQFEQVKSSQDEEPSESIGTVLSSYAARAWELLSRSAQTVVGTVDKVVESTFDGLVVPKAEYRPDLPDEVFIDHRQSGCLNEVRHQGLCGSCYIFSTIALYEWAYCKKSGSKIEFSEQYPVDCGRASGLDGCNGGLEVKMGNFVKNHGFELRDRYNYVQCETRCPYDVSQISHNKMGSILMNNSDLSAVMPMNMEKDLRTTPLLISIYFPEEAKQYGGGLYEGVGCATLEGRKKLHSVLLIGSGREDGHEYWLIRNSFGVDWGESGYLRLRKDSGCVADLLLALKIDAIGENVRPEEADLSFEVNQDYNNTLAKQRAKTDCLAIPSH